MLPDQIPAKINRMNKGNAVTYNVVKLVQVDSILLLFCGTTLSVAALSKIK